MDGKSIDNKVQHEKSSVQSRACTVHVHVHVEIEKHGNQKLFYAHLSRQVYNMTQSPALCCVTTRCVIVNIERWLKRVVTQRNAKEDLGSIRAS